MGGPSFVEGAHVWWMQGETKRTSFGGCLKKDSGYAIGFE